MATEQETQTAHVRVGVRPASKRIVGDRGRPGVTLCGEPITDRDMLTKDARNAIANGCPLVCHKCRAILEDDSD